MILPIHEMINSSSFKSKICKQNFIQVLGYLFDNCEELPGNKSMEEFRTCLFMILETMAKNSKLLL
jgi:hypothetical protein